MREILFRGKSEKFGNWIEGSLIVGRDLESGQLEYLIAPLSAYYTEVKKVIPETVGQYTGLTDKNGKHIFEGDIIDTPDRLIQVVWLTGNAQFDFNFIRYAHDIIITNFKGIYMRDLKEYEVIGNIHDNPELLGGE